MNLGVMQPYFFPYLGYFELIQKTDRWVVFDTVQYNARSWMNRNRILHPIEGTQYIGVPVRHAPKGTPIREIRLIDKAAAERRVLGQLAHYRRHAPYYEAVTGLVGGTFAVASDRLVDVNLAGLSAVCRYLAVPFTWQLCSDLRINGADIGHAGAWALAIARHLDASRYINPPGGRILFRPEEWREAGIELRFTEPPTLRYSCAPYEFVEHLSILDVLMWMSPDKVRSALMSRDPVA